MNIALIIAGGVGVRTGQEIPKQFLTVNDIPIIIYTLKVFQEHSSIDNIVVVTLDGWHGIVRSYCRQFGIAKMSATITGGASRFDSLKNGVDYLKSICSDDDIILAHDANRPLVDVHIISDVINICRKHGNALSAVPCVNSIYRGKDGFSVESSEVREEFFLGQSPEAIHLGALKTLCEQAQKQKFGDTIAAMLTHLKKKVYLASGSVRNFKITTREDIDMFKALLTAPRTEKIKQ